MQPYKHIIFDLGGVLVELDKTLIPEKFFPHNQKITLSAWSSLPVAHQFERGEVSAAEFAERIIHDFDLEISVRDFIRLFSKWPKRVYPGAKELLTGLGRDYCLSILSNCNEIHWPIMKYDFEILKYCQNSFSSHLLGITKPDTAIFNHVLSQIQATPADTLFFDDNEKNIESAKSLGINAIQVQGINAVKAYLKSIDIL